MNNHLYRPLIPKSVFQKYIPKSGCNPNYIGSGDTGYSLMKMADVVYNNVYQGSKLSTVLQQKTLAETCASIHNFLYNNFQYKVDESDQILRSLSCSWAERETGIDCKSFSISASIILSNLGLSHAFRRVKQPTFIPEQFTHVYVIVYNDQQNKDISKGYYVIDGTLPTMDEVAYITKDDFQINVSGLGYYGGLGVDPATALAVSDQIKSQLKDIFKDIFKKFGPQIENIKNAISKVGFWKAFSCNTNAFGDDVLQRNLSQQADFLRLVIERINEAVAIHLNSPRPFSADYNPVGEARNKAWIDMYNVFSTIYGYRHHKSWSSECTKANLVVAYKHAEDVLIRRFNNQVLQPYLDTYFDITLLPSVQIDFNNCRNVPVGETCCGPNDCQYYRPNIGAFVPHKYTLKQGVTNIPLLEFTAPVVNVLKGNTTSVIDIIDSFKTLLPIVSGGYNNSGGGSTIDFNNPQNPNYSGGTTGKTNLFGANNLILGGLILGVLFYGFKPSDKNTK